MAKNLTSIFLRTRLTLSGSRFSELHETLYRGKGKKIGEEKKRKTPPPKKGDEVWMEKEKIKSLSPANAG